MITNNEMSRILAAFTGVIDSKHFRAIADASDYISRANMQLGLSAQADANGQMADAVAAGLYSVPPYHLEELRKRIQLIIDPEWTD